ncbi:uncharacterized protein [Oscarella lobularis]|uniref:uncharacterized protein n=1 Tax=Oscarella lobularis TaxID=121494 RepID=UPI003313B1D3
MTIATSSHDGVASSLDSPRPIHVALKRKRQDSFNLLRVVRNLLESGHNPAEVDGNGQTALHVCSTVGAPLEVLRLFVDRVDPVVLDKPDFSSLTPLHCLLIQDGVVDPACLECLVAAGASLTSPSETRGTPLDCLARRSNDVAKLFDCLLDVSLDVLRQNEWSLLRIAFADGSVVFMKVIMI